MPRKTLSEIFTNSINKKKHSFTFSLCYNIKPIYLNLIKIGRNYCAMSEFGYFAICILFLIGITMMWRMRSLENQKRLGMLSEELLESKQQLQTVFNNIDVAVWCYDGRSQKIPYTSKGMKKITGYPSEQFIDRESWKTIIHPDDVSIFEASSRDNRNGISRISEYRIIHAGGHIRWVQNRITPTMDQSGKVIRLDGVIIDITSRKKTEEALDRSEQRYKSLFEYNSDVICEMDLNGTILDVNPIGERITGQPAFEEDKMISWLDFFHAEDIQRAMEHFEKTKQGQPQNYEINTYHSNGKNVHWNVLTIPIYINDKIEGVFTIGGDITSKKMMEKALVESDAKNRLIVENIADLNGILDPDGTIRSAFKKGTGSYGEGVVGASLFDFIHREDLDFVRKKFSELMETKINQLFQFRLVHTEGYSIFVECLAAPIINNDGEVESIAVVARDVTEKKRMEKELKESEELNRRLVELSPRAIVFHYDYKCMYVNPAALVFLGVSSLEDIIGRPIFDFIHPDFQKMANSHLKGVYEQQNGTSLLELKMIRKDQTVMDAEAIIIPMSYMGKNAGFSIIRDVTKQKKAEEERNRAEQKIRESEERYSHL
ncbi:PAS domain-containing protein, partial [Domibacillus tundrae]|uniref:PAS domain-containing protein n=1 Tax=Domibacillus tundrae TaxID=1587527 RepID=UPI003399C6BA